MEEIAGEGALAVTAMHEPRSNIASLEAIYDHRPDQRSLIARLSVIAALHEIKPPQIFIEKIPPIDWLEKVAQEHPPLPVARLLIYSAHDRSHVPSYRPALQLEAATAFGTGEHPTTFGCLLALQQLLKYRQPRHMLDLGCGSGILALAAARLAHQPVLAVDNDAESVRMARYNARTNYLHRFVRVECGSGYAAPAVRAGKPYDLIMANIFARPLMLLARDLRAHLAPGGTAILSGLLNSQENMVLAAHRGVGLKLVHRWRHNGWSVLVLEGTKQA
jgi:ribosomal protein L11 methyltransferase